VRQVGALRGHRPHQLFLASLASYDLKRLIFLKEA
jgi:hypothetical protein